MTVKKKIILAVIGVIVFALFAFLFLYPLFHNVYYSFNPVFPGLAQEKTASLGVLLSESAYPLLNTAMLVFLRCIVLAVVIAVCYAAAKKNADNRITDIAAMLPLAFYFPIFSLTSSALMTRSPYLMLAFHAMQWAVLLLPVVYIAFVGMSRTGVLDRKKASVVFSLVGLFILTYSAQEVEPWRSVQFGNFAVYLTQSMRMLKKLSLLISFLSLFLLGAGYLFYVVAKRVSFDLKNTEQREITVNRFNVALLVFSGIALLANVALYVYAAIFSDFSIARVMAGVIFSSAQQFYILQAVCMFVVALPAAYFIGYLTRLLNASAAGRTVLPMLFSVFIFFSFVSLIYTYYLFAIRTQSFSNLVSLFPYMLSIPLIVIAILYFKNRQNETINVKAEVSNSLPLMVSVSAVFLLIGMQDIWWPRLIFSDPNEVPVVVKSFLNIGNNVQERMGAIVIISLIFVVFFVVPLLHLALYQIRRIRIFIR